MSHFLILQHDRATPRGTVSEYLKSRGHTTDTVLVAAPNLDWKRLRGDHQLVILGGEMNVDQEEKYPWMTEEKKLIREHLQTGRKALGLCLGGQLLAEALGAKVGKCPEWEVGWHEVQWSEQSPFAKPANFMAYQWHGYCFETPANAIPLASTRAWGHQAYLTQDQQVLGFQFHPESTVEWIKECCETAPEKFPKGSYVQNSQQMLSRIELQRPMQDWFFQTLDNWLQR